MSPNQIRIIERLRAAANEHGEVSDLLVMLRDSFSMDGKEPVFIGAQEDCDYLNAAMMAADFAQYDRERVTGRG